MRAADIMSAPVVSVGPDTPVEEIAALLFEKRISAVPVLEEGRLIGLVSEGDLLRRKEIGTNRTARAGSWWLRMFNVDPTPAEYVKSHARRAQDVMVHYFGTIQSEDQRDAARVAAENIPGVRGVEDHRVPFYRPVGWE